MAAVTAERADVVLDVILVRGQRRTALLALAIGDYVVAVAEVAKRRRVAACAIGKGN